SLLRSSNRNGPTGAGRGTRTGKGQGASATTARGDWGRRFASRRSAATGALAASLPGRPARGLGRLFPWVARAPEGAHGPGAGRDEAGAGRRPADARPERALVAGLPVAVPARPPGALRAGVAGARRLQPLPPRAGQLPLPVGSSGRGRARP